MELAALVRVLTDPSTVTVAVFCVLMTAGGMKLWYLIEKKFDAMEQTVDDLKCGITDTHDLLERKRMRLNSIDETLYYVLEGLVELGVNGRVKKYRDKCAAAERWEV